MVEGGLERKEQPLPLVGQVEPVAKAKASGEALESGLEGDPLEVILLEAILLEASREAVRRERLLVPKVNP